MKKILTIFIAVLLFNTQNIAQTHHFKFQIQNKKEIKNITNLISIDNFKNNTVWAYANDKEFSKFSKLGYKIENLPLNDSKAKVINMATTVAEMANWDKYPTYDVYGQMMQNFATNYSSICKLDTISDTQNGRKVLVLKISDNVDVNEAEPEFFYTSTMHGDETTGFVLMLRLADYLLSNYGTDTEATDLINNFEIFINPDANPDGTYYGGDNDISGSRRYLANGDDPNRDFPYPLNVNVTSSNPETIGMEDFATAHHFVMSANFHGGAEVYNYPWDCWTTSGNAPADATWWEHLGRAYVDSARLIYSSYMTSPISDGVTEGGDWYVVNGSRQDYMNYFNHCKEVTIELSGSKTLSSDQLPAYWNYNERSLINYIKEAGYGFNGTVKNTNGDPLDAKIEIISLDKDSSNVVTDPLNGDYYRPIEPGIYTLTYSSSGYTSQNHTLKLSDWQTTLIKNVILEIAPNPHSLSGTVTEEGSGNPVENVKIEIIDNLASPAYTDVSGTYNINDLEIGTYFVIASKNGYSPDTLQIEMTGNDEILNFSLKSNITITGTVTEEGTGNPLENVTIEILNSSIPFVLTNTSGVYSINDVPQTTQQIKASKSGYTAVIKTVDISTTNTVIDFTLTISNAISFESTVPSIFTFGGNLPWTQVTNEAYDGTNSMKSGDISDDQTSVMETELNITAAGNISFYKKVSSESSYDYLKFYIDDVPQGSGWSGEIDWSQESFPVTTGLHTFKWVYSKDGSLNNGDDCAWVDYIEFPQYELPPVYTVTFNVSDGTNPIENAEITFNSQNKYTDASGQAMFTEVNPGNNLPWTVEKSGYNTENGTLNIIDSDINKDVTLTEIITYTVTFNVTDASSTPLQGANVNFNSQDILTDAVGQAVFNTVEPGNNLPYTITKSGYIPVNADLNVVDADVQENVSMNEATYNVTFIINDGTNPIQGANVYFNSQDILTDAAGHAVFNTVEPGNNLPYTISKTEFNTYNGTINVNANTELTVSLSASVNVDVIMTLSGIKISPNPFNEFTTIEFFTKNKDKTVINIYSYQGKLIKTFNLGNLPKGNHKIIWNASDSDGYKVTNGIYFIKIQSGNLIQSGKVIIVN